MEKRENYTPMEFEYDNKHGLVTNPSPFFTHAMARSHSGFSGRPPNRRPLHFLQIPQAHPNEMAETSSSFSSEPPSTPSRDPSSQSQSHSIFSNLPNLKTPQQNRQDAFRYPRDNLDLDLSSGAENMSSPGCTADNEDTPEPPVRTTSPSKLNNNVTVFRGNKASPTKEKPSSNIFAKSGNAGRGNMLQKKRDDVLARRVHKRKRVESNNSLSTYTTHRRPSDDSGSEGYSRPTSSEGPASKKAHMTDMGKIGAFFSYIERHPRLPHVLSFYLQLFCNFLIVFAAAYIAYSFWATIIGDVDIQSEHAAAEILVEMAACARDYQENGCKVNRVPAMETMCNNWEKCMNRDPKKVGRARMSAHTFAEIFNSFVEPISYKAMVSNHFFPYPAPSYYQSRGIST